MAQAMLDHQRDQQKQNKENNMENSEKDPEKDSGVEMDVSEDLQNLNIQEKLGLAENKQVILTGKHIRIQICEIGNLYMEANKDKMYQSV
jgi:hypothetical protein